MSVTRIILLLAVLGTITPGCVDPIRKGGNEPVPVVVDLGAARQFEVYRKSLVASLREAAELAESGGTEQAVRELIADRNATARVADLSPMMAPLEYEGDYSPQRTADGLRAIANDLESGGK